MTLPVSQACRYWGLMSMCGITRTDADRARELTGIAATRGKEHPTARLSGPCPGKAWHRVQELAGRARKRRVRGGANRDTRSPTRDSKNAIALACSKEQPSCAAPSTSSHKLAMPQVRDAVAPGKTRPVTAGAGGIPSCRIRLLLRASHTQAHPASTRTTQCGLHGR